jgi:hypothetical protein
MTQLKRGATLPRRTGRREIIRERNNKLTIRDTWQYPADNYLASIPALESAHPLFTTTYLQGPVVGVEDALVVTVTLTYVGFDPTAGGSDPADSPPRYWWDGSDRTAPIQYLNRDAGTMTFAALVTAARTGGYEPLDDSGRFIEFPAGAISTGGFELSGLTDFLDLGGSWNCERFDSSEPDVSNSCRWVAHGDVPGGPPTIRPDTTWLYLTPSFEEVAPGLFFIKEKWIPSQGDSGWNEDVYEEYV